MRTSSSRRQCRISASQASTVERDGPRDEQPDSEHGWLRVSRAPAPTGAQHRTILIRQPWRGARFLRFNSRTAMADMLLERLAGRLGGTPTKVAQWDSNDMPALCDLDSLRQLQEGLEGFIQGLDHPVVVEDDIELFDLTSAQWRLGVEFGKLVFEAWSPARSI